MEKRIDVSEMSALYEKHIKRLKVLMCKSSNKEKLEFLNKNEANFLYEAIRKEAKKQALKELRAYKNN